MNSSHTAQPTTNVSISLHDVKLITVITFYAVAVASRLDPVLWLLGRDNFFKFHFISGWERVDGGGMELLSLVSPSLVLVDSPVARE